MYALAGSYYTNNPERVSTGGRHDTVGYLTVQNYGAWQTGRIVSHWVLSESGISYVHSPFGTKNYGSANVRSQYDSLSGLFSWRLLEDYGQLVSNPSEADTPLNRSNFNVFATGPTVRIPLGARTRLESSILYTRTYFELGTLGGNTTDEELGINRSVGIKTTVGLFAGGSQGSTEEFGQFTTQRASLRLASKGAWTTLVANAGINKADRPVQTGNLPFFDFDALRTLPLGGKVGLKVSRSLTNATQEFGQYSTGSPAAGGSAGGIDLNTSANLFDATVVRASYSTKPRRTEWVAGLSWRKEDALDGTVGDHRRYATIDASYYRVWGAKTGIRVYGAYGITRGELRPNQYDHQTLVGLEFAKPLGGPGLRWVWTLERSTRTSNDELTEYSEIRIGFYLRYSKFIFQRQ